MALPIRPAAVAPAAKPAGGSMFSGMKGTKPMVNSEYVRPGVYVVIFTGHKQIKNRKGESSVAVDMQVVHVEDSNDGKGHRLGASIAHVMPNHGPQADYFKQNVVSHIGALAEIDPTEVDDEMCNLVFGETQPLKGTLGILTATNVITKQNKDFTRISYEPLKASDAMGVLTPDEAARFFPNDLLTRMAEAETK